MIHQVHCSGRTTRKTFNKHVKAFNLDKLSIYKNQNLYFKATNQMW